MPRIEYLINNPTEVELSDLELLDAEITKYPYFYSLRALKLLALKKFDHQDFEQELQITSVFNSDPETLYQFLHAEEFEIMPNEVNSIQENDVKNKAEEEISNENIQETEITDEIDSLGETNSIFENEAVLEKQNIQEELIVEDINPLPIQEIVDENSVNEESIPLENSEIEEETVIAIDHSTEKDDESENSNELKISVIQEELEKEFLDNSDFITEEIDIVDNEDSIEEIIIESDPIVTVENNNDEAIENNLSSDENISASKIVSVITEEAILDKTPIIEETNEIEESTIEELPEVNTFSIENSIEAANDILEKDTMIAKAVEETREIYETPIEQVDLVNRSYEIVEPFTDTATHEIVSTYNTFQILNTKDEIIGGYGFDDSRENQIEQPEEFTTSEIIDDEFPLASTIEIIETVEQDIVIEPILEEKFEETIPTPEVEIEEPIQETEEVNIVTEKIESTEKSQGESFSFNDWLKIPQSNQETTTPSEKEMKFQIIEEFLDKNPKIKPLKKIEVPEHKAEVRDIKQTDFSDLMTETLAQIYIEQKQYEKAIKAYKILILKYPEKNSLFANQIKEIENLKNSK